MLIDEVEKATLRGGDGGAGIVSFGKKEGSGPDGGNGGAGGDLYIQASSDLTLLNQFSQKQVFSAQSGRFGQKNKATGRDGEDYVLHLPVGSTITSWETGEVLLELDKLGDKILFARGGRGGMGNWEFRSARNTTPRYFQSGEKAEVKIVKINLKFIADFGLIGLPNAGKSSLLNELTNAQAKTANYSFTTLSPNLGVIAGKTIADIPGLIEGAHQGRGLGIGFLKHIEKVKVLLHCIDVASVDPITDYETVRKELENYNSKLLKKKEIILITKTDLVDQKQVEKISTKLNKVSKNILPVSIHDWESLEKLKSILK